MADPETDDVPVITPPRVATVPPPASILPTISRQIDAAIAAMPKDKNGLLVLDVKTTTGVNLAFVKKFEHDWDVLMYVGKKWGEPVAAGVTVRKTFD